MIDLGRCGFPGFAESSVTVAFALLTAATAALFAFNLQLFVRGYRLGD